ncbi:MAG: hypothetical protein ACRBBN_08190 [Methyloligellaceae bacterium]
MLQKNTYLKIMRASAWYDLVVTAAFATPWSFLFIFGILSSLDQSLNIPGSFPQVDHTHILFANLLGSVVVVWSVMRLMVNQVIMGRGDMVARFTFATWQIYAVASGASYLILAFTVAEIVFGILQSLPVKDEPEAAQ